MPRLISRIAPLIAASGLILLPGTALGVAGIDWNLRASGVGPLYSVTYGNGTFVGVGPIGNVMTSTDGVRWIARDPGNSAIWTSVTYGNGRFVAVSCDPAGPGAMYSLDGVSWTDGVAADPQLAKKCWRSVAYGNGYFVAVGDQAASWRSPDGARWSSSGATGGASPAITFAQGRFLALIPGLLVGSGTSIVTSIDGAQWGVAAQDALPGTGWSGLTYGDGAYVATASSGAPGRAVASSINGTTGWIQGLTPAGFSPDPTWASAAYGEGIWVAVNSGIGAPEMMTSPNRINWTERATGTPGFRWSSVTYARGLFVAVSMLQQGYIATSGTYTPPAAPDPGTTTAPPALTTECTQTFYQQGKRTIAWNKKKQAYKVTSRIRIYQDAQKSCRTDLTVIYRNANTKVAIPQKSGSTLGYRKLQGGNFNAPVISWPTKKEMRFTTGDTTGQNRKNARLVMVSYLKKNKAVPKKLRDIELVIVRRIPQNPAAATSSSNPLFAQRNSFGTATGWAKVG